MLIGTAEVFGGEDDISERWSGNGVFADEGEEEDVFLEEERRGTWDAYTLQALEIEHFLREKWFNAPGRRVKHGEYLFGP